MIEVKIDIKPFKSFLSGLFSEQIPYATARGLTTLANESRAKVVADLPGKFILRTSWWKPGGQFGMNVKTAKKTDWPMQIAEVYTRAQWMVLHEDGGLKTPVDGGKHITLPTTNVRRNKSDIITRTNRPRGSAMVTAYKKQVGGGEFLVKPVSKTLRLMYLLKPSAKIPKRFGFEATVRALVERRWRQVMDQELDDAIRTAK